MYHDYIDPSLDSWISRLPTHVDGEVQTISEITGTQQHKTLAEAITRIRQDPSVWKISYTTEDGWRRITVPE
jgi:hypothetical protein